jgi:hypothetical protein
VTVWRWLSEDAIKPWQFRSWIFPRDPEFTAKAGRILDLYAGRWEGQLVHPTLEQHLLAFGRRYEQIATPLEWKFTRADLDQLLNRVDQPTAVAA